MKEISFVVCFKPGSGRDEQTFWANYFIHDNGAILFYNKEDIVVGVVNLREVIMIYRRESL